MVEHFGTEILKNQNAETAPTDAEVLALSQSRLEVRTRGSLITECLLTSPETDEPVPILYSPEDTSLPKLDASHAMSPVGPSKGVGGQHGFPRWADYYVFPRPNDTPHEKTLAMQAKRSDLGEGLLRKFTLGEQTLTIETTIQNDGEEALSTSLGEHLYFYIPEEDIPGLYLNGQYLDELLKAEDAEEVEERLLEGKPLYWPGFDGEIEINFPDGRLITLTAELQKNGTSPPGRVGLLFWHRPGTDSICIEPVVGFMPTSSDPINDNLVVNGRSTATLTTRLELEPILK